MEQSQSILSRKLDLFYFVFFLVHIPVMLLIDLVPFYPASWVPSISISIREFYIATYRDRFFTHPPLWFKAYTALEACYHLPVSIWMLGALLRDDRLLSLQLLIFAIETAVTTLTCVLEMLSWEGYSGEETRRLCGLYLPYLGVAVLMGLDSFVRLRKTLLAKVKQQ